MTVIAGLQAPGPGREDHSGGTPGGMLWAATAVLAGLLATCAASAQPAKGPAAAGPPPAVIVGVARLQEVSEQQAFTGRVEAIDKVEIRARVSGFLKNRGFVEGAEVAEGQILFELEKEPFEAAVALADANVEGARAALELAQATFDRTKPLAEKGTVAQANLDDARSKLSQARALLQAQEANLTKAKIDLSYTVLRAPMHGRTGRATYALGEYVSPSSSPLVTLVRQDPMYVAFPVPQRILLEARRAGLNVDSAVARLRLPDGSTYDHDGVLKFVEVAGNAGTDTVTVRASFPNPKRFLVDQQLVGVTVMAKEPQRKLMISQSALMLGQQGASVLVVNNENKVESRRIVVGEQRGPDIVVISGLTAGERIIVSGHQKVRPGMTVEPHQAQDALTNSAGAATR